MSDPPTTAEVWRRFGADLRAFVARRVPETDADDVVQDVMLRIHRTVDRVQDAERIAGWVHRVARSAIADHHRRRRPSVPLDREPEAPPPEDDRAVRREVAGWLRPMIAELPAPQREALELVELEGLGQRELAERLSLSPSGARTRVQRARAALRRRLDRCCAIALDARGGVVDYRPRDPRCCE